MRDIFLGIPARWSPWMHGTGFQGARAGSKGRAAGKCHQHLRNRSRKQLWTIVVDMSEKDVSTESIPGQNWIMCNACCRRPSPAQADISFYLTKCGHIFCQKCLIGIATKDATRSCLYCKKQITICRISNEMPQSIQSYFRSPKELLREAVAEITQTIRFQTMHANRLAKRMTAMRTNCEKLRQFCYDIMGKKATLERELLNKGGNVQDNLPICGISTPVQRMTTIPTSLQMARDVEASRTSVIAAENTSKSETCSSVATNLTCSLNDSVVAGMAKISVEKQGIFLKPGSSANLISALKSAKDVKELKSLSTVFDPPNRSSVALPATSKTTPRKRQISDALGLTRGFETVLAKKTLY